MATGIIIHIEVGSDKRTEFFSEDRIRIGSDENCDLQIETKQVGTTGPWIELENTEGVFRVINFDPSIDFAVNDKPIRRYIAVTDGDVMTIAGTDIRFSFFALVNRGSLIRTNREQRHVAQFIEEAALDAAGSPRRDEAKAFLREFVRELSREISTTSKLIALVLSVGFITGVLYLGFSVSEELRQNREQSAAQAEIIKTLKDQLGEASNQLGSLQETNRELIGVQSLAQNVRVNYGAGVCLIIGVYDLVDRRNGKVLRYGDARAQANPYEPTPSEDAVPLAPGPVLGLTTEGTGSPVEYDFIGTGFHVGGGYVVTNKHVLQPWTEDDLVKTMIRDYSGRARIKRLVIYFPNYPQPFTLKIKELAAREDVAVATIDTEQLPSDVPALPLESDSEAATIGKSVVTMGYPSGPDRLLAMVDDDEAKSINARFGNSRQNLINFLAQSKKIVPLTTQGAITDLDTRRIVHDAKTAEGGSGAPLFGQSGKVIGVNFGVFTENTAANMAVPVKYAIEILRKAGWKPADEMEKEKSNTDPNANSNANTASPGK
ncbi:MAG: trypsin-like peptidase domain-containing protein [Pyrinomonadaceae bacterium]|nr:trypsin-like peptidase domain-containing protein [Blastocatellia bacterium]MCW5957653.1 trypsin-like peptidase domain-containing protein [Pyrinomonadaceae bacterium]